MTVTVIVVAVVLGLAAVVAVVRVARGRRGGPYDTDAVDRAELQARQRAVQQARRPEHGYGADRTYGGGGPF